MGWIAHDAQYLEAIFKMKKNLATYRIPSHMDTPRSDTRKDAAYFTEMFKVHQVHEHSLQQHVNLVTLKKKKKNAAKTDNTK